MIVAGAVTALVMGVTPAAMSSEIDSASAATEPAPLAATPPTKVTNFNHADPAAIQHNGVIYSYATDGTTGGRKIPTITATSPLGPYTQVGKTLNAIPWADGGPVMGPHVVHKGGSRFHMYFTTGQATHPDKCIGVAVSLDGPLGPFVPRDNPLACDNDHNGAIAPSFFNDPRTGRNYLLYKTNGPNAIRRVWLQGLGPDGLAKDGSGRTLLGERDFNYENPQIIFSAGKYFLFMSRDGYETADYKTTVNWSSNVDGPYPADRAHAIMTRENTHVAGPGSAELLKLDTGEWMAFFHGWIQDGAGCDPPRFLYVATIAWGPANDNPHLAAPRNLGAGC